MYPIKPPFTLIYLILLLLFFSTDPHPIKQPFTLIYLFLVLLFFSATRFPSPLHFIFSHLLFSQLKIFIFSHMKLLAQLPGFFFFFTAFFSNSVRLLLNFPSINPVRIPQKKFMFSHIFFMGFFFYFYFGCIDVVFCEIFFFFLDVLMLRTRLVHVFKN